MISLLAFTKYQIQCVNHELLDTLVHIPLTPFSHKFKDFDLLLFVDVLALIYPFQLGLGLFLILLFWLSQLFDPVFKMLGLFFIHFVEFFQVCIF